MTDTTDTTRTTHTTDTTDLTTTGRRLLSEARTASAGRSAVTVFGSSDNHLHQTLLALRAGSQLSEHENPGEATVHLLDGVIELHSDAGVQTMAAGELAPVPAGRHSVTAVDDSLLLLTVSKS